MPVDPTVQASDSADTSFSSIDTDVERSHKGAGRPVDPTCQPSIEADVLRPHKGPGRPVGPTCQPSIEALERSHKGAGRPVDPTCQTSIESATVNVERLQKGAGPVSPTYLPSIEPPCHTSSEAESRKSSATGKQRASLPGLGMAVKRPSSVPGLPGPSKAPFIAVRWRLGIPVP